MLDVMREWQNDILTSMNNTFLKYEHRIMFRFNQRMSVCKNGLDEMQTRKVKSSRKVVHFRNKLAEQSQRIFEISVDSNRTQVK